MSRPSNVTLPPVGSISRRIARAGGRLAAARLADEPERLAARGSSKSTPSTALHVADLLLRSSPRVTGKYFLRSRDDEQIVRRSGSRSEAPNPLAAVMPVEPLSAAAPRRCGGGRARPACACLRCVRREAARATCPPPKSDRHRLVGTSASCTGSAARTRSPAACAAAIGGWPWIGTSRSPSRVEPRQRLEQAPACRACCGAVEDLVGRRPLDDLGRRT